MGVGSIRYMNWPKEALQSVAQRFLAHVNLPSEDIRVSLIDMCSIVHTTSNDFATAFQSQLQRHVYTTPKSYLDLIQLYLKMLKIKQTELQNIKSRMEIGVKKLDETNSIVDNLKGELIKLQPILTQKAAEAEVLLKQVSIDQKAAAEVRLRVSKDEAVVGKQAEEVSILQADAQKDLDIAMPALSNAQTALNSLSKSDITEVKSFAKPPEAVETVMSCVCLLLGEKQTWDAAQKVLKDSSFIERLMNYDKDNIPAPLLKKLSKCVSEPGMSVEVVSKVSKAATSLCMWAHAMDVYSKVAKEVGPKKANLDAMNEKLQAANAVLKTKQDELRVVNEKVMLLEKQCKDTLDEKDALAKEAGTTEKRLVRAEKLISGLSVEGKRWKESVASLGDGILAMVGDTFLAAASISYYGAFTGSFRQNMVDCWREKVEELQIPCSQAKYSLATTLGSPVEIREWQLNGLPTDGNSTDNAILATRGERWPLMIDPQGQANKWIKKTQVPEVTKMTNANLLRSLESCIRVRFSLLIEDIEESLEPALEPILQKAVFKQGGRVLIHLGDSDVDYDPAFKLWITTKCANPHYLPEVYIKVTIINFTVTMTGLEDQLLGDHERPDIEEKKNRLVVTMAQDKKQLKDIEDRILQKLSESSGNVLDDEGLIDTLASSNATSKIIKVSQDKSKQTLTTWKPLAQEMVQRATLNMLGVEMCAGFGQLGTVSMEDIYKDTDRKTPCIFVLSAGADPTGMLLRFAKDRQFSDRLHLISLGQGQGPRAEALIEVSKTNGDWVLLQNCHLAKSWMPALEKKVDELATDVTVVDSFRLFLTSFPAAYFPVTVLQNGIKLTNEPPKGIRANLIRSFVTLMSSDSSFFDMFESGPLGWNIKYEFNDTDLETSYACLRKFLAEQPIVPWDALRYVTGQINYGGRVTDDWDRRCLTSILNGFYTPQVLTDSYKFSASGTYSAVTSNDYAGVMAYFESLPVHAAPEIFGMHENANVTFERNESWQMINIVLSLEPRDAGGTGGQSNDEKVLELAASIQAGPTTFRTRTVLGTVVMDSLATVLSQELVKFNNLLSKMRQSLMEIQRAIQGLIVMSSDLDNMYTSFLNGRVPGIWDVVSFASLKALGPWVQDLLNRVAFFRTWLVQGEPVIFPLPAFFFPQGFMTGTLQNFARKYQTAIDCLGFTFAVMECQADSITSSPSDGIYVDGLWLEDEYPCPVYKTSVRKGTLSTTGMSTNFVVAVYLPSTKTPDHWVLNGAAFLLNLD
ncbi:hypothetical protein DYB37_003901 [Aphanomyces astaci]|uniref:Uncharacterized protein n=1 Tax=Aphanomyces astaci TaxID=112090 RepID=A0A3R7DUT0_APHAT|nr:hypothetical protein DYB35_003236 [Aphanomyces astaci]RHZ22560.1 hypothetical protein DYB37_003901 [Aphanomyces astaci]